MKERILRQMQKDALAKAERRIAEALDNRVQSLDLAGQGLTALPESIGQLTLLQELSVTENEIERLPESIGGLTGLRRLYAGSNQLAALPESIGCLQRLQTLDVSDNRLAALPESLGQLKQLRRLDLGRNRLRSLPVSVGELARLEELYLSGNQLSDLPPTIANLTSLRTLNLAGNRFRVLPETITQLTQLHSLDLSAIAVGRVMPGDYLTRLYAEGNRLTRLPLEIGRLSRLQRLAVVGNQLSDLPASLSQLKQLEDLWLHDNPGLAVPPEMLGPHPVHDVGSIKERVPAARVLDYYFSKRASHPLNEAKMILVGRGGVGKTSLVNRLVHGRYNPKETKTDGIAITQWPVKIGQDEVRLNIWDFGGQEIMHATHQFFLTKRSLYLLVLNAREGEQDGNVEYWLRLIQSFGADSPVIIVINKAQAHAFDLNRRGLKEKFPAIRDFLQTDCDAEQGLEELRQAILRETDRLEHLRDPFPASWFSVKDTLAHLREREGENFIPFARYQQLCAEQGVKEAVSQETLVGFLHDLGIVVNFRDDPRLSETHVLNPEWVTNGIYKILNADWLTKRQGVLELGHLAGVLDREEYPKAMHLYLLDLMRKFELCYEMHDGDGHYLVPELLGKEEPDLGEFFGRSSRREEAPSESGVGGAKSAGSQSLLTSAATDDAGAGALRFDYRYNILPEGLLPRFIVRSRALNQSLPRWRTGVVLAWEGNRAVVKADLQDRTVSIAVVGTGAGRRRLLSVIRSDFEVIHRSITKLEATEEVPVPGQPGLAIGYEELRALEEAGEKELTRFHKGKLVKVKIADLLNGVEDVSTRPSEPKREAGAREGVRVAFSYSHKDEALRDQLEMHLKLLQRQGIITTWHDRKLLAGDKWAGVIDDKFQTADIILLLVSSDFLASDYCYEIELKTALERAAKGEAVVVPIILRTCDWSDTPFAKFQALPKDALPVVKWTHPDDAWTDIERGIKKLAEERRKRGG